MSSTFYGSIFAGLAAFFLGALGCSNAAPQKEANSTEARSQADILLAGVEPPERAEEGQPQDAESDGKKPGEEVVEIPLDQIWAVNMPRTRDVRELEPDKFGETVKSFDSEEQVRTYGQSLLGQIFQSLASLKSGEKTKAAFAVEGTGLNALRGAHAVLTGDRQSRRSFDEESDVSIVFFTHPSGWYVHVREVTRGRDVVNVRYDLIPHETKELTQHFALIPLGKLPKGKLKVQIIRTPIEKQYIDAGFTPPDKTWESRVVCRSFRFEIEGNME